jgi:autotransporter-associated beta strand protein
MRFSVCVAVAGLWALQSVLAADQTWYDASADNTWSTNAANWDAGAAVWANGNSALFTGGAGLLSGETVDLAATVTVANVTFQTNGYVIADVNNDGSLSLVGAPSVFTVSGPGSTAAVSEVVGGGGGLTKSGPGLLQLKATNTYAGVTRVSAGVLKLNTSTPAALGAAGAGNETVVESGATLDFNSAYYPIGGVGGAVNVLEDLTVSGSGADGAGALINTGSAIVNGGFRHLTLAGDTVIGGPNRLDLGGANGAVVNGNGYTLYKTGTCDVAVSRAITNCPIVVNQGYLTIQTGSAFGGTDYGTTLNGGTIYNYTAPHTFAERFTINGGAFRRSGQYFTNTYTGEIVLNARLQIDLPDNAANAINFAGVLSGAGGFLMTGPGSIFVTGNSNTWSGATVVASGNLFVGVPRGSSGLLGSGAVTNNSALYIDRSGAFTCSNAFMGTGNTYIRYGAQLTVSGSLSSNSVFRIGDGALTLTNGAAFCAYNELTIADRLGAPWGVPYPSDPTNVTATVNVLDGTTLLAKSIVIGNGNNLAGATVAMTGTVNQVGGTIRTTGNAAEENGIRLGHYPAAYGVYNMMGGTLTIEKDWDLCIATDGSGWFNMTGGTVYTKRMMLNERDYAGGYGRLTVSGGTLNVGSLTGSTLAISNAICADLYASYLVELGGAGGTIRAVTNLWIPASATLYGTNANAITIDSQQWTVSMTNRLTGAGGLNKTGSGTLVLSGNNAYTGPTRVLAGSLVRGSAGALPAGGLVLFGVAADGSSGRLYSDGDLSLAGIVIGVANPELLDKSKAYTIASYGGSLTSTATGKALPGPWYLYYDWPNKRVLLKAAVGTLIRLQ